MCGIAGLIGFDSAETEQLSSNLQKALLHRGPNDRGLQKIALPEGESVAIHTRLSILDTSPLGHQPMELDGIWIVFNGLIYNYRELRKELEDNGHVFKTQCDTEVILHAFKEWGIDSVKHLNGMFSFAIFDRNEKRIWLVRDRLGIKPLYYCHSKKGGFAFASELRALLTLGDSHISRTINRTSIESFLSQGAVWGFDTIVEDIKTVEPGQVFEINWRGKIVNEFQYWNMSQTTESPFDSRAEAVEAIRECLISSVEMRLVSDVPLGLFLSGGVDSGVLATLASRARQKIQTISVGFDDPSLDETESAQLVASKLGTDHTKVVVKGEDIVSRLDEILSSMDQPTVDGFNTYIVSKAAKDHGLTVSLSGLGGDELFGGYSSFTDVSRGHRLQRSNIAKPFISLAASALSSKRRSIAKVAALFERPDTDLSIYLLRRELYLRRERRALWNLPNGSEEISGIPIKLFEKLNPPKNLKDIENRVSFLELNGYMRHMLLRDADVFSMAHPLEVRTPFLDHRLVELSLRLKGEWKRNDGRPKPILVDAVEGLPSESYSGPKRGFTFPWDHWLRGKAKERAKSCIQDRELWQNIGFQPAKVASLWQMFEGRNPRVNALQILGLLVLSNFVQKHSLR